jgi:glutaminyl-peptide cyclotransferase
MGPGRAALISAIFLCFSWLGPGQAASAPPEQAPASGVAAAHAGALPSSAVHFDITIVKTYPHDPEAFTQGLVFFDGFLYESTGLYGKSSLRKVDLETGAVLKIQRLAENVFGEGLTLWQGHLIQLTWRSGIALVYDLDSLQRVGEFHYRSEGWGLTHNGQSLIMSDGTAQLRFLDPDTFNEELRIEVRDQSLPIRNLNALAYVKGEIFANIWQQDTIAVISPTTGRVLGWIDLSMLRKALGPARDAEVLNGIAYDAARGRIFVTGKHWPKLFEIKLVPR